jgi:hypothetical protein
MNPPVTEERFCCSNCQSTIPDEYVFRKIDDPRSMLSCRPTTQTVKTVCPHCRTGWKLKRQLMGGNWAILEAKPITLTSVITSLINQGEKAEGARQMHCA